MLIEIRSVCTPTLDYLLSGSDALSDQHNSGIFKSVQKFIIRSKRFSSANKLVHVPIKQSTHQMIIMITIHVTHRFIYCDQQSAFPCQSSKQRISEK